MAEESILSINKLAHLIGVSREVLEVIADSKASHYSPYITKEKKRDGSTKDRAIDNPDKAIRGIQKRINKKLLKPACRELPAYCNGSIEKRGTLHNASPHASKEALLLVDISNCFPSINSSQVHKVYRTVFGCSPPVAKLLTKLTTYGDRLPQGAPTSPSLCNLVLAPLSQKLYELASTNFLDFTQYVDDLTFSGDYQTLLGVSPQIITYVQDAGFKINRKKLKLVKNNARMEVTGLVVNKTVGVGRSYIRKVQRSIFIGRMDKSKVKGMISYVHSVNKSQAKKLNSKLLQLENKNATMSDKDGQ